MLNQSHKLDQPLHRFFYIIRPGLLLLLTLSLRTTTLASQSDQDIRPLELGTAVERELAGGQSHSYRIELSASQYIHLVVDQRGIDVVVSMFGPDGKKTLEVDSPNGVHGEEPVFGIAAATGMHRLEVRSLDKDAPAGRYEVKIRELRISTQDDVDKFAAQKAFAQAELLRTEGTTESLQGALRKYEEALSLFRRLQQRNNEASTLLTIGRVHEITGDKKSAARFFELALPIFKALGDRYHEAIALNNIGSMLIDTGDSRGAIDYYEQALPIIKDGEDKRLTAMIMGNLGSAHSSLGDQNKALQYFLQVLPMLRDIGDRRTLAALLNNIGGLHNDIGNKAKALDYYLEALSIFKAIGDQRGEIATLTNIGGAYGDLGNNQKSLEFLERALVQYKTFKNTYAEAVTVHNIGGIYLRLNNIEKALEYFNQAQALRKASGDQRGEAWTLNHMGSAYERLGDRKQALDYYKKALSLWGTVKNPGGEANTSTNLMSLFVSLDNYRSAVFYGKRAVNSYQNVRTNIKSLDRDVQKTYLVSVTRAYRGLAELLIEEGRLSEAQQVLNAFKDQQHFDFDQARARALTQLTLTSLESNFDGHYEKAVAVLAVIGRKVAELRRKFTNRQPNEEEAQQLRGLETQLAAASAEFFELLKQGESEFSKAVDEKDQVGRVSDTTQMQAALRQLKKDTGQTTVAVYTLVGGTKFYALIITADDIISVWSPIAGKELNSKARQLWGLLQSDTYDPKILSHELYNLVFKPIKEKLPVDTKTILWSLDGNLRYLPMAALYDGKQYLVERYNHVNFTRADGERLTRAPSRQWTGLGLGSAKEHTVELLGSRHSFGALPGVAEELRAVFRGKGRAGGVLEGEVLPDDKFTKSTMLVGLTRRRPVVHIASHFSFRPGDETRSFLLLGDGSVLTLAEMKAQRELFGGVELLTLSACNTAAQQADADGREIDAFAELAQRLGANAVMATLWPLADESSPWLMQQFYAKRQVGGGMMKAEALRKAQLTLLTGSARIRSSRKARKTDAESVRIVLQDSQRGESQTRADVVYVEAKNAPPYKRDEQKPYAHPHYWAPVILIGNLR